METGKENERQMFSNIFKSVTYICLCVLALFVCTGCEKDDGLSAVGTLTYNGKTYSVTNHVLIGAMNPSSEFIIELNAIITRFKTILAQEFGRKTKSKIQSP